MEQQDDSEKYLELHIVKKLNWKLHINKKLNQRYTRLRILQSLLNHVSTIQFEGKVRFSTPIHSNNKTISNLRMPCLGSCLKKQKL